jgi:hypothetical protein
MSDRRHIHRMSIALLHQMRGGVVVMGEDTPNKHDATRNGQGIYQPDKTETPKDQCHVA